MPVPPAMKRSGTSAAGSGSRKLPIGPSTRMSSPDLSRSTAAPKRVARSTFTRNSSHPSRAVSPGAEAMEYGVDSPAPAASEAAWPARYGKDLPSRPSLIRRVVGVAGSFDNRRTLRSYCAEARTSNRRTGTPALEDPRGGALDIQVAQLGIRGVGRQQRRGGDVIAPAAAAPALAPRLVLVHPAVGCRQQRLVGLAVLREHRGADADAELQPLARPRLEEDVLHRRLQLLAL